MSQSGEISAGIFFNKCPLLALSGHGFLHLSLPKI